MGGAWVAVFVSVLVATQSWSGADSTHKSTEQWYAIEMMGDKAGWMVMREQTKDGRIISETEMRLELLRGGQGTSVGIESRFVETGDGEPVSMTSTMKLGAMPTETEYIFEDGQVRVISRQGDQESTATRPAPTGEWLTPAAAAREMEKMIDAERRTFSMRSIDPTAGLQIVESNYQLIEQTTIDVLGKRVPAIEWRLTQSMMPGTQMTIFTDLEGTPIRTETNLAGVRMIMLATEKELALSDLKPSEIMFESLVRPSRPIDAPRQTRRGVYTLSIPEGSMPQIPDTGVQQVRPVADNAVRVTIDLNDPAPAPRDEVGDPKYLGASSMIDPRDSEIRALAARALEGAGGSDAEKAERLRRFVHVFIDNKSLDVGFASASEVCRTAEGDCTEHGVLLAALLRTQDIPARVATGLIYVDQFIGQEQIFGYHMWTQALLDVGGEMTWVDLDATFGPDESMDATHIALSVSALDEGSVVNSIAAQAPLMGQLEIEVHETVR